MFGGTLCQLEIHTSTPCSRLSEPKYGSQAIAAMATSTGWSDFGANPISPNPLNAIGRIYTSSVSLFNKTTSLHDSTRVSNVYGMTML